MVSSLPLGVIQAEGVDAASFLQGQLTHDVLLLPVGQARLAGYCSAKGRLMASFWVLKLSPEKFILVCHASLIAGILKRLSMFVMRAKAKLTDASDELSLWGLAGNATKNMAAGAYPAWAKWEIEQDSVINLYPAATVHRQLMIRRLRQMR